MSSHAGARPLCAPYQGKYFSWLAGDRGEIESADGQIFPYTSIYDTSYGEPAGLFGINCGHKPMTRIPGMFFNHETSLTAEEMAENDRIYQESQKQRALERQVRRAKTEATMYDAAGDEQAFAKMAAQVKRAQEAYKNYCKEVGRTPRQNRTKVDGYDRSMSQRATQAVRRQNSQGLAAGSGKTGSPMGRPAPTLLEIIDTSDKNLVKSILKKYERIISDSDTENAIVVTKDGKVYRTFGDKNNVYPNLDLGEELQGASVTHNHPIGSQNEYSFSDKDLTLFEDYELEILRGIDELFEYEINRNGGAVDEFIEFMNNPDYNPDTDFRHDKSIEYAEEHGYGYTRKKHED